MLQKRLASGLFTLTYALGISFCSSIRADTVSFCPAYWQQGGIQLRLFPLNAPGETVPMAEVAKLFQVIWFSRDGKSVFGQARQLPPGHAAGITKIEFNPMRQSIVPGSDGFGKVAHLTASPSSGRLLVAGWAGSQLTQCGYFEIDPKTATVRMLRAGSDLDCRQGPGPISPNGRLAVSAGGGQLGLLDLETAAHRIMNGLGSADSCNWSPDSRLLACNHEGAIVVVDVETCRLRKMGGRGNGDAEWSPDGKHLLVFRSQLSCMPTLYGESLAVIDVDTGKRSWVKSAHCEVTGGSRYGWVDRESVK